MERVFAFVDESGNHDLNTSKQGSSKFFVVCSILVADADLPRCYEMAESVRSRHFQKGEIKSSNLRPKDSDRRKRILDDLAELPLKLFVAVVEKERVIRDGGLQYKTSFIKFVNDLLYARLFQHCPDAHVTVDEHGGVEFQASLKAYVEARYAGNDLFGYAKFETKSSKSDVLIQVADFFAGTIAQIYEGKAAPAVETAYKRILGHLTLGVQEWPPKFGSLLPPPSGEVAYADHLVHKEALKKADQFLAKVGRYPDEDERLQSCILDYLRFKSEFVGERGYISTGELRKHLIACGFSGLKNQKLRSNGIAKLRDADVIIASGGKGYKIPQTRADVNDYVHMVSSQVIPLLDRVKKAHQAYLLSSLGDYDILTTANVPELKKLVAALDPFAVGPEP